MKFTKARIKQIIQEELNEMAFGDEYGDDTEARMRHIRDKRKGRGYKPVRAPSMNTAPPNEEARMQAMVSATKMILKMNPAATLLVDADTYAAMEASAPELLDRLTVSGGMK